jgi:hypothetical protein
MKNTRKTIKNFGNYFRELSIVTLGVAITLAISAWINYFNDKRNVKLYLGAIKLELEENIKSVNGFIEHLQVKTDYSNYLRSTDKGSLNRDSINTYRMSGAIHSLYSYKFQNDAFEMFKTSGMMRLINDKELLLTLWKTYSELDMVSYFLTESMLFQKDEMIRELHDDIKQDVPLYVFYAQSDVPREMLRNAKKVLSILENTLSIL